ncbi:hypothetical protein L0D87_25355, partial [Klebsiella pneumoniae]|nr:hypothetical protein [Klebsiella pneumoniae]
MTIMKVHYSPTDGIPLNSLYLKETSTTERSGSVLGGGISGDSVILGGGGYAGSEMQKTTRSSVFAPPDEVTAEPDNTKMVLRISCVIGVMFLLIMAICILGLEFIHSNPRLLVGQKAASGWIFLFFTTLRESNI